MSFDNLNNANKKKANLAIMILFTVIALAITVFMPFLNFLSLAFLPVPVALLLVSNRLRDALICAVAGVILLFIFNYILASVVLVLILAISFDYRYMVSRDKKVSLALLSVFLILVLSVALFILITSLESRQNVLKGMLSEYFKYVDNLAQDPLVKNYQSLLLFDSSQFNTLIRQTQAILRFIPYLIPGFLLVFFGIVSLLNYYFSYLFFKRFEVNLKPLPVFKGWDLHWYWCWGIIIGIIMVIIPRFNKSYYMTISAVGLNLIIIFGFLYLILGIAALWGFFERINFRSLWRYIILIFIFFTPGFILFLPFFGLIDIWANFRKLNRT
jgi:uncharacterized protein YybS (DUF2232 family)